MNTSVERRECEVLALFESIFVRLKNKKTEELSAVEQRMQKLRERKVDSGLQKDDKDLLTRVKKAEVAKHNFNLKKQLAAREAEELQRKQNSAQAMEVPPEF